MLLESGPALKDRLYNGIFALVLVAYAGWCYYDGTYGYINKNREEARKNLTKLVGPDKVPTELGKSVTRDTLTFLRTHIPAINSPGAVQEALKIAPIHEKRSQDGVLEAQYYVSDYGMITVPVMRDTVDPAKIEFEKWKNEPLDIQMQFYMMYGVLALGAYMTLRVVKGSLLRATINEQEFRYGGTLIPIKSIKRLTDYSKKGLVTVVYEDAAGRLEKLRLDDQKIHKFQEIIDALCKLRGFDDPRQVAAKGDAEAKEQEEGRDDARA